MAERPILFGAPMVRAILAGKKTQTRRVVKLPEWVLPNPYCDQWGNRYWLHDDTRDEPDLYAETWPPSKVRYGENPGSGCPYGEPGDTLWVREAWCYEADPVTSKTTARVLYRATDTCDFIDDGDGYPVENKDGTHRSPWKSPLHMPRSASRLTLLVKSVRVERLQEISEEDAIAEGVEQLGFHEYLDRKCRNGGLPSGINTDPPYVSDFRRGWDSINGARAPWSSNPWVWVVEFQRVTDKAVCA